MMQGFGGYIEEPGLGAAERVGPALLLLSTDTVNPDSFSTSCSSTWIGYVSPAIPITFANADGAEQQGFKGTQTKAYHVRLGGDKLEMHCI